MGLGCMPGTVLLCPIMEKSLTIPILYLDPKFASNSLLLFKKTVFVCLDTESVYDFLECQTENVAIEIQATQDTKGDSIEIETYLILNIMF